MMYTQDYDETFPTNSWDLAPVGTADNDSGNANFKTNFNWIWQLYPYTKNRQVWVCPSDPPLCPTACYSKSPGQLDHPHAKQLRREHVRSLELRGKCATLARIGSATKAPQHGRNPLSCAATYIVSDSSRCVLEAWWIDSCTRTILEAYYGRDGTGGGGHQGQVPRLPRRG